MNNFGASRFGLLPPVVKNLLILNGLFFLASLSFDQVFHIDLNNLLGLHYYSSDKFSPYQFITYMFMHGSFLHIFSNMFALWMFGKELEMRWGPSRFLTYFLVTGLGAAIIQIGVMYFELQPTILAIKTYVAKPSPADFKIFLESGFFQLPSFEFQTYYKHFIDNYNLLLTTNTDQAVLSSVEFMTQYKTAFLNAPVVIGASGAVFGILLAFGMMFPNTVLYIYFAIPMKAKYFVMLYGGFEIYAGLSNRTGDNVAHFAHLGGMIFGFILIMYWKKTKQFYK